MKRREEKEDKERDEKKSNGITRLEQQNEKIRRSIFPLCFHDRK